VLLLAVLCSTDDAKVIYRDAMALDLVNSGYAWIVTEQALLPDNTPIGDCSFLRSAFTLS